MVNLIDKITNIGKFYSKPVTHDISEREEFKIVRDALVKYGMNVSFFDKNLPNLYIQPEIEDGSIVEGSFNARTNSISMPKDKYQAVHELFHMASKDAESKNELMGVLQKDSKGNVTGIGFNEGIADYFTHLSCPDYEPSYAFEERIISIISEVYGLKPFNNNFTQNPTGFYNSFGSDILFVTEISKRLDSYNKSVFGLFDLISSNNFNHLIRDGNRLVNEIFLSVISTCSKLCELLELKGIDSSRYMVEMQQLFESKNNNMEQLRSLVESSDYKNIDNIFNKIKESNDFSL